jgi:pimeloyl-ACP methyl ester carboxylesterase
MKKNIKLFLVTAFCLAGFYSRAQAPAPHKSKNLHSKTVVFVTGAFVSNIGWDEWRTYFESKGYKTIAPPWPYKEESPAVLRNSQPDSLIATLRLKQLVDYYADIISKLPEKPILIGHSQGGLITQLLLQRGIGEAGVAYHSAPPKGVLSLKYSFIKSVSPALGLFRSSKKTYLMTFKQWQYAFTNGMPLEVQQATYDRLVVPESRSVLRDALGKAGKIDFKAPHAPLLFISGSIDHILPASLNYSNYKRYKDSSSITDYKELPGRNHFAMGQPTWKEDADYILAWIQNN